MDLSLFKHLCKAPVAIKPAEAVTKFRKKKAARHKECRKWNSRESQWALTIHPVIVSPSLERNRGYAVGMFTSRVRSLEGLLLNNRGKSSRDNRTIPAFNFLPPFTLPRPELKAQQSGHSQPPLFKQGEKVAWLQPGCLKAAAHSGCSLFLRLHGYLARADELLRNTPGKEVTSAGTPSYLPSFLVQTMTSLLH